MAMDNFLEEVATKRNRGAETVMYVLANIMMVVFGLWAFLMLQGIMMLINAGEGAGPIIYYVVMTLLTGGIAVLLFLRRDRIRTEYEYTFTNGQMDFAQVFNNKKRKNLGTMNLKNVEALLFQTSVHNEFKLNDKSSRAIIDTVATYLTIHAAEKISLQAVAEEFGFNYTYLSYLFKKTLGKSPSEYLTQCRIDQAKRLLTQSEEHSIKEISNAVGYDDPYYFSRIFKATTGLSPSEYRKQNGETI